MELLNALKSLFTKNTTAASTSGARIPILNSSSEVVGSDSMANLASVLGVQNYLMTYKVTSSGNPLDVFKSYVDETLPSSDNICLIHIAANTHVTAIGIKTNPNYSSFIVFGYIQPCVCMNKQSGTWATKSLE